MKYNFDQDYFKSSFRKIVETPSPVGYYVKMNPIMEAFALELGYRVTYDNRSTIYITLEGEDNSKTVMLGAHLDTLGMMVRKIDADGKLRVRAVGGVNFHSLEGESVTVHTRDGRSYTGLVACQSHSVHVFEDARSMERDEDHMMILLDEKVASKEEVKALGIRNGDYISIDPRCQFTPNGFIKSRFIDDKAAVACSLTAMKYIKEHGLKPKYKTIFAFPYNEEIGFGGTYVPEEVSEYVALDIGLIGPELEGNEFAVSICAKDKSSPYDYDLTTHLIHAAERVGCEYAVDLFYRYGSDGTAALRAGNNLRVAAFGMAVYCSHGMERTHMDGICNTINLLLAYILGA